MIQKRAKLFSFMDWAAGAPPILTTATCEAYGHCEFQ